MSSGSGRRTYFALPPGAQLIWHAEDTPSGMMALPLWLVWSRLSREHAAIAEAAREPDRVVDARSRALQGTGMTVEDYLEGDPWRPPEGMSELDASLIAVVASALAIDGFYGSVKAVVQPPTSKATRRRRIIEALKLGFTVGRESQAWGAELDWLFNARDKAVHHSDAPGPMTVVRTTGETVVVSSPEAALFSAPNARRAADFCTQIIDTCLARPKRITREWAAERRH